MRELEGGRWQRRDCKLSLTHIACRIGRVCADLSIDFDQPLLHDPLHLVPSQRVLETVPQEDDERYTLP